MVDELFNKDEEVQARKLKTRIGKEFFIEDTEDLSSEFDIEAYVNSNRKILKKKGLNIFLSMHGWTTKRLMDYFTQNSSIITPITSISFC
jgi:hypothetical protein